MKALIYGNGESRKNWDITKSYKGFETWGCNAIYRDCTVDNLVAIDYGVQQEIYESGYVFKNKCRFADWAVLENFDPEFLKINYAPKHIHETERKDRTSCVVQGKELAAAERNYHEMVDKFPKLDREDLKRKCYNNVGLYITWIEKKDKVVYLSLKEQYLPKGPSDLCPRSNLSVLLSLSDKLDTLLGFFLINEMPTSSKDPYALRRSAIGLLKMILENNKELKLRDLINYSCQLYKEQNIDFSSKNIQKDLSEFFNDRFKNFMKEKGIRNDIIESATLNYNIDIILKIYKKTSILNKLISKETGKDLMFSYKRASNIISNELKNNNIEITQHICDNLNSGKN